MKIPHVTIHVKDMERSILFYKAVAGIDIQRDLRGMGSPIVFLTDDTAGTKLELVQDAEHSFSGSGVSVGFAAENAEKEMERIRALGYKTTEMVTPNPRTRFFFVPDPDGFMVQVIEG